MLETVRRRSRSLVKLIELKKRTIVYSDFEDEIGAGAAVQLSGVSVGTDMERFRAKSRRFLLVNSSHIAILKLRRNEPLTPTDLSELERTPKLASVRDIARIQEEGASACSSVPLWGSIVPQQNARSTVSSRVAT
jgi:type I restriction enzyme, R subunit